VCPAETVKRLSCKWKGQTSADDVLQESAGSPISQMPQIKQKAGYVQDASPIQTKPCQLKQKEKSTIEYWQK
jgi:hypothetical protein